MQIHGPKRRPGGLLHHARYASCLLTISPTLTLLSRPLGLLFRRCRCRRPSRWDGARRTLRLQVLSTCRGHPSSGTSIAGYLYRRHLPTFAKCVLLCLCYSSEASGREHVLGDGRGSERHNEREWFQYGGNRYSDADADYHFCDSCCRTDGWRSSGCGACFVGFGALRCSAI